MLSTHSRLSKLWRLQRSRRQEIKLLFLTLPWLCNMTLGKQYRRSEAGSWDAGSYTVACLRVMLVTRKTSPPHKHPVSPNFTSSFKRSERSEWSFTGPEFCFEWSQPDPRSPKAGLCKIVPQPDIAKHFLKFLSESTLACQTLILHLRAAFAPSMVNRTCFGYSKTQPLPAPTPKWAWYCCTSTPINYKLITSAGK